jgi:very-short-patch-repair endonuclease
MCVQVLRELQDSGYTGTVGVVTPFRPQATRIGDAAAANLRPEILERWGFLSATAHGFQGDERDLMIYSLCCGEGLSPTSAGWLGSPEGRCLMNVAMTRARAVLHIIGNQSWAEGSGIAHLASLARSCRARTEHVKPPTYESVWEERFDQALRAAGISTVCQHPVAHRRLDLAVLQPVKIDIEVDGESFHRAANGRRKDDDAWRDIQMRAMGWKVLRFWVYELREDMAGCVQRVRTALET